MSSIISKYIELERALAEGGDYSKYSDLCDSLFCAALDNVYALAHLQTEAANHTLRHGCPESLSRALERAHELIEAHARAMEKTK